MTAIDPNSERTQPGGPAVPVSANAPTTAPAPLTTEEIVALFRKAISFQDGNKLELVFETEEEADAAGDFLLMLETSTDDVGDKP